LLARLRRSRPAEPTCAATPRQFRDPGRSLSWVCRSHARDERPRHETQVGMVDAFAACLNLLDGHLSDTSLLCPPNRVKLNLPVKSEWSGLPSVVGEKPERDTPRRPRPMTRIPPAEQLGQLAEQLAMGARQGTEAEDLTSTLVRLGARKLIEELLEAETSDILGGRGRYERRHAGQQGLRNGYKRRHIDCAEGRLEIEVPQIRGVQGVCQPALWAALQRR